jgi:Flp pilus assembly protein TadD
LNEATICGKSVSNISFRRRKCMKIVLLALAMLVAACASPPPPAQTRDKTTTTANPSSLSRDTTDCERQAALAGAGERAKAFESCMKAKNRTPQR